MRLTDAQCAEVLAICHARNRAGRVLDSHRGMIRDEQKGQVLGVAQGGPTYWMKKLIEVLGGMMQDPEVQSIMKGGSSAKQVESETPPETPGPSNPSGKSTASTVLAHMASDRAPLTLDALAHRMASRPRARTTLSDLVSSIRGGGSRAR
jgi:hypothetical protein